MLIRNARVVTRNEEFTGTLRIENGVIVDLQRGTTSAAEAEDWDGDYLLPGLVELHTDNLEKHLAPRRGVRWNIDAAFVIHDAQVAAFRHIGLLRVLSTACANRVTFPVAPCADLQYAPCAIFVATSAGVAATWASSSLDHPPPSACSSCTLALSWRVWISSTLRRASSATVCACTTSR
ncbi:hypothetical protein B0G69_4193 [Paraburkholderia sp. RAU2J]|nr:hypothetical protein B0G69_4193 [Paraburkholderia sp. RAU2J]